MKKCCSCGKEDVAFKVICGECSDNFLNGLNGIRNIVEEANRLQKLENEIRVITSLDLEQIREMFLQGYTLTKMETADMGIFKECHDEETNSFIKGMKAIDELYTKAFKTAIKGFKKILAGDKDACKDR
ncbi:MAG: hypothetical protein HPY74_19670 [Firmicutes bacterium]|nr:hypothetical protein [Bacillota bacterium]